MDPLADFEAARAPGGQPLKLDGILNQLDQERADALRQALADPHRFPHRVIARTLTETWKIPVSEAAVNNWRRRARG